MCNSCWDHCKHDVEKIRQEAVEEFSKRILFEIEKARVIDDEDVEEYKIIEIINSLAKSYNLPNK